MRKHYIPLLILVAIIINITACSSQSIHTHISQVIGVPIHESTEIEYEDNHGGFHDEGIITAVIKFDEIEGEKVQSDILKSMEWTDLPLSENLSLMMYGGERNTIHYNHNLAEVFDMPNVTHGYYFFLNRHPNSLSPHNDKDIFDQASFNFTLAIYDVDRNIMYYLEFDT